jgi:hypothetical protein
VPGNFGKGETKNLVDRGREVEIIGGKGDKGREGIGNRKLRKRGGGMDAKGWMKKLMEYYPEGLHPSEVMRKDLVRCVRTFGYSEEQLEELYEKIVMNCEFFPKVYDVVTQAGELRLPTRVRKPELVFETWVDERGRAWAREIGQRYPESTSEMEARWRREAVGREEGFRIMRGVWEEMGIEEWKMRKLLPEVYKGEKRGLEMFEGSLGGVEEEEIEGGGWEEL